MIRECVDHGAGTTTFQKLLETIHRVFCGEIKTYDLLAKVLATYSCTLRL